MDAFKTPQLSKSKRPVLEQDEIELKFQGFVNIYENEKKTPFQKGDLILTNHRLFWIDPKEKQKPLVVGLKDINIVENFSAGAFNLKASPKIQIGFSTSAKKIQLSFKNGGKDAMQHQLEKALHKKAWAPQPKQQAAQKPVFQTTNAGISGILKSKEEQKKNTDQTLKEAFSDMNSIIEKAKDLVGIAERLTRMANKSQTEDDDLRSLLISVGIASPVTK